MRIAIVHHWFVTRGGGERVAECIASLFPDAELFTLFVRPEALPSTLRGRTLHTSMLQRVPGVHRFHREAMPLYPEAVQSLDLRGFDIVLSSDSGPIKGVRVDPGAIHICYCHSPMRYLWDGYDAYRATMGSFTRLAFTAASGRVRRWDQEAASQVTCFIANSHYVADRIRRCYGREAEVLHPPIDFQRGLKVQGTKPELHYLCAGRLVAYKRTELLIQACHLLGRTLRIAGTGPEEGKLRRLATNLGSDVVFLGELTTDELWTEYARCRALLFAADEDFGMVPLEAQASGRPVIAYGAGGSLETVRCGADQATGTFFPEQSIPSVAHAIAQWEIKGEQEFQPSFARRWAENFATPIFLQHFREMVLRQAPAIKGQIGTVPGAMALLNKGH